MTTACIVFLCISLLLYLIATLLFQAQFLLLNRSKLHHWGRRALILGAIVSATGLSLHFAFSRLSPLSNMLSLVSLLVVVFVVIGLAAERWTRAPNVGLVIAPLAFISLLYPLLMPVRFEGAQSVLLQYPWLGVHVLLTLLGYVGFALAFCAAVIYLVQMRDVEAGPPASLSASPRHRWHRDVLRCRRRLLILHGGPGHGAGVVVRYAGGISRPSRSQNLDGGANLAALRDLSVWAGGSGTSMAAGSSGSSSPDSYRRWPTWWVYGISFWTEWFTPRTASRSYCLVSFSACFFICFALDFISAALSLHLLGLFLHLLPFCFCDVGFLLQQGVLPPSTTWLFQSFAGQPLPYPQLAPESALPAA